MSITLTTLRTSPRTSESIDYTSVIFRLSIDSAMNFENSEEFATLFKTIIAGGALKLMIDLSQCHSIDSSGIGILVNTAKQIRKKNGDLAILKSSEEVDGVIKLTNLDQIIRVFINENDGVEFLSYIKHDSGLDSDGGAPL